MSAALDEVRLLALELSPRDQLSLIGDLTQRLRDQIAPADRPARRSMYGALAHLGPAPSEEDIREMRREVWKNFPRDPDRLEGPAEGEGSPAP